MGLAECDVLDSVVTVCVCVLMLCAFQPMSIEEGWPVIEPVLARVLRGTDSVSSQEWLQAYTYVNSRHSPHGCLIFVWLVRHTRCAREDIVSSCINTWGDWCIAASDRSLPYALRISDISFRVFFLSLSLSVSVFDFLSIDVDTDAFHLCGPGPLRNAIGAIRGHVRVSLANPNRRPAIFATPPLLPASLLGTAQCAKRQPVTPLGRRGGVA
jgi:hypothetical protein